MLFSRIVATMCLLPLATLSPSLPQSDWETFTKRIRLNAPASVEHAVSNAPNSERAVIFVHVEWSWMYLQGTTFLEFAYRWQGKRELPPVGFHYVDCSSITDGYAPFENLELWSELRRARGGSLIHGMGELIWLERGRVLKVTNVGLETNPDDLLAEALITWSNGA